MDDGFPTLVLPVGNEGRESQRPEQPQRARCGSLAPLLAFHLRLLLASGLSCGPIPGADENPALLIDYSGLDQTPQLLVGRTFCVLPDHLIHRRDDFFFCHRSPPAYARILMHCTSRTAT